MISPRGQFYWSDGTTQRSYDINWEVENNGSIPKRFISDYDNNYSSPPSSSSPSYHSPSISSPLSPQNYHYEIPSFLDHDEVEEPEEFWSASISVVDSLFSGSDEEDLIMPSPRRKNGETKEFWPSNEILLSNIDIKIQSKICSFLTEGDLGRLAISNKKFSIISSENLLWKELYLSRWKLTEKEDPEKPERESREDEWAWISSLLEQNDSWKEIYKNRHKAECWKIGTLKMFNGCWGFISQSGPDNMNNSGGEASDIFFHRKDIDPEGAWVEDWWLKDTAGVSRSQKCGYWDTFLCGRKVRYKQRAAYAKGRRPQACQISFIAGQGPIGQTESGHVHALPRHITGHISYVSRVGASASHSH